jgi:hypothetical protein
VSREAIGVGLTGFEQVKIVVDVVDQAGMSLVRRASPRVLVIDRAAPERVVVQHLA